MNEIQHPTSRLREVVCVLLGHAWDAYSKSLEGREVVSESNQCSRCRLAKRIIWIKETPTSRRAIAY